MAQEIYTLLKDIFFLLDDGDRRLLRQYDLSPRRFYTLFHLAGHGELSPTRLGALLLCDKANVTRLLAAMERDKLIQRSPDPSDGRRSRVTLSPEAERLWPKVSQAHAAYCAARLSFLLREDQETLHGFLIRLKSALREQLDSAEPQPGARS
jgi:DNA-binding MarR family transcriptional regulator